MSLGSGPNRGPDAQAHVANLLTYFTYAICNAMTKGFNSKIQSLKRGFRTFANFRIRILFFCGRFISTPHRRYPWGTVAVIRTASAPAVVACRLHASRDRQAPRVAGPPVTGIYCEMTGT